MEDGFKRKIRPDKFIGRKMMEVNDVTSSPFSYIHNCCVTQNEG